MKVVRIVFTLGIVLTLAGFTISGPKERLWISFTATGEFGGSIRKYLMRIDALGNVIIPPFRVSELGHHRNTFLTALSLNGSNKLNFWYPRAVNLVTGTNHVLRLILDKDTLKAEKWVKTDINATNAIVDSMSTFDVTNRKENNFISLLTSGPEGMQVIAHRLNQSGDATGETFALTPPLSEVCHSDTTRCKGGSTANGRLVYWIEQSSENVRRTNLFVRPLATSGEPIFDPVLIDHIISHTAYLSTIASADATNRLSRDKRFLVYTKQPIPGRSSLLLQEIDASTGNKEGDSITLLKLKAFRGNVRIDPKGRFVLFISNDESFGLGLTYIALDVTGFASGTPKILSDLAVLDIDLLREDLN